MEAEELSVSPVEMRDLPWISALMQKMVDTSLSRFASREQIETIVHNQCSQEALVHEMRVGNIFVKLSLQNDIAGFASYKSAGNGYEAFVDRFFALPGEYEQFTLTTLVNYIREHARQAGYSLLSVSLPPGEQQKLELLSSLGFIPKGLENMELWDGLNLDAYVLSIPLDSGQISQYSTVTTQ